ncbi:MAG TPA: metallophosphoesterase [Gaiellaceae bacterium]|nr:metallophosphoesterase [Gaiellaceae bacterium]
MLVQLSDSHIGADWGDGDSVPRLAAAVAAVLAVVPSPEAVLVSGDLVDHGADAEYEQVRELLAPLEASLYVLPGNHDDRSALRRHFDVPGADAEPVQYAVGLGALRLVVIDTTRAGEERGDLDARRLAWLQATLAEDPDVPTLVAMHHAPVVTGIPGFDELALPPDDRRAFGEVVARHPHVRRIVAGHMHRTLSAGLAGRSVLVAPSTYVQARLELGAQEIELSSEPRGFAVHAFLDGELVSHVQLVPEGAQP